jgi:hypothetical protein
MAKPCFIKKKSAPPVCGVHNVALVPRESSSNSEASRFGDFIYLECPVTRQVVNDGLQDAPDLG